VLTSEKSAPQAAAALEKELVHATGFKTGPPRISTSLNRLLNRSNTRSPTASASCSAGERRGVSSTPTMAR
jgi:hypothetical protein